MWKFHSKYHDYDSAISKLHGLRGTRGGKWRMGISNKMFVIEQYVSSVIN
jgi:hypothetical protein